MALKFLIYQVVFGYIISSALAQFVLDSQGHPRFIAARKGDPPPCDAKPGQTYCENVKDYPYEIILSAIKNSNFDVKKFLVDESRDEGPNFAHISASPRLRRKKRELNNELPPLWETGRAMHLSLSQEDKSFLGVRSDILNNPIYKSETYRRIRRHINTPAL